MRELRIREGPRVEAVESKIPDAAPGQVVIKVAVAGANPKDWKMPMWFKDRLVNEGEDIAGTIHALGEGVVEFKTGDRVAALHEIGTPYGAYGEYALAWTYTTFHLPPKISFEEASTIPLTAISASWALFRTLSLPTPWFPASVPHPLLVYGGSTALGAFAIKLAVLSNIHPIIAIAGNGHPYVKTLLSSECGDKVFDYREGEDKLVQSVRSALGDSQAYHAIDAVGKLSCVTFLQKFIASSGKIALSLPIEEGNAYGKPVAMEVISSTSVHQTFGPSPPGGMAFGYVMSRYFTYALQHELLEGHPYEVVAGGLDGVQLALERLKAGKASAKKFVLRVSETA